MTPSKTIQIPSSMLKQLELRQQVIHQSNANAELLASERNFYINKCLTDLGQDPKLKWNLDFGSGVFSLLEDPKDLEGQSEAIKPKQKKK